MTKILEARLADVFFSSARMTGVIHSKFRNVFNILFKMPEGNNRLLTVLTPNIKGVPDSLTVAEKTFSELLLLPIGSGIWSEDLKFHLEATSEVFEVTPDCLRESGLIISNCPAESVAIPNFMNFVNELEKFRLNNDRTDGFSTLSASKKIALEKNLRYFSKAWLNHDRIQMESLLLQYIGLGIGLTPSADDAFLGIIAVFSGAKLYADNLTGRRRECLQAWIDFPTIGSIAPFYRLLFNRTTDVSLKYLSCAQEGRFSDVIIDLISVMFSDSEERLKPCIESVSMVGGSSGMDTLFGMAIACQELGRRDE